MQSYSFIFLATFRTLPKSERPFLKTKFDPKKTIFLIDGSSILYRGYYGVRPLHTTKGIPVHAVYNFCRMIKKLMDSFSPEYIAVIWDVPGRTTRHEMYDEYKSTRQAPPSDLFDQKEKIVEFSDLIGLKSVEQQGIEADDIMYSIAKEQADKGNTAIFVSSDKDMGQAISDKILIYDPMKETLIDEEKFQEKNGFPVGKLPFYFALLGDASDNIPGVRGIGKKTAQDLVTQFDSLEDMYDRIDTIAKARVKNLLLENKQNAFLSRKLFLLQYHPSNLTKDDFIFDASNWVKAEPLFQELEFRSLLKDVRTKEEKAASIQDKIDYLRTYDFKTITTEDELRALCTALKEVGECAIDVETDGKHPMQTKLVGVSVSYQEGSAYYIPCGHTVPEKHLSLDQMRDILKPMVEDSTIKKYLHNGKYDELVLAAHGMHLAGYDFDTLVAAGLVCKDWQKKNLKALSVFFFKEHMLTFDEVVKTEKVRDFSFVGFDIGTLYSAMDSHQTLRLVPILKKMLKDEGMEDLYYSIEFPLIQVLFEMEWKGIYCDKTMLASLSDKITYELNQMEQQIYDMVGKKRGEINLNSPKQMQELLFKELNLPPQKKSAKGTGYSTDASVLKELAKVHPVPGLILMYRELYKIKSTYVDALPEYINPHDQRIHTSYSQTRTSTGRLASYDPNMQNIPTGKFGLAIRAAFKPAKGNLFVSADYSQIELRVLAYLSQDQKLLDAFRNNIDIHRKIAADIFDVSFDKVTNEQRQIGKRINFSILYGLTPYGLSKELDIPFSKAKEYIEIYFEQYPGVQRWMDGVVTECEEKGYVTTLWGRRRYIPAIYEKNRVMYEEAKRMAINTVAQGTAAEIMKKGMLSLSEEFKKHNLDASILLQIHDELIVTIPEKDKEICQDLIKKGLESVVDWNAPLVVDIRSGSSWKEISK